MTNTIKITDQISSGYYDGAFRRLYGSGREKAARLRYLEAVKNYEKLYGYDEVALFSVSGRSELSGNHTDHNHGKVIACSISLDIIAVASQNETGQIRIKSEGFSEDVFSPDQDTAVLPGTSLSLIAGICDGFAARGYRTGGLCAYTTSHVLKGSGLSSSAAFEDMVGTLLNHFYNGGEIDALTIARISQHAENKFYGKPCGLMDQIACAAGGVVALDFGDAEKVALKRLDMDLDRLGYALCIVNTHGSHAGLTDEYAAIPAEMKKAAGFFAKEVLREVSEERFLRSVGAMRERIEDRAILRGMHFFAENRRVQRQCEAIERGDFDTFLQGVRESGLSSFCYLQNVFSAKDTHRQPVALALAVCEALLTGEKAAWRVHGGGFAGTVQAFVPRGLVPEFKKKMDGIFSAGSCLVLNIRADGAVCLDELIS